MRLYSLRELDYSEGTAQLHTSDGTLLLNPQPNPLDINDPLRWQEWKKYVAFSSVCAFAFLTNYAIGGLAPAFYPLSLEFDKSMTETSTLLTWPVLVLGAFNFFWVPMANYVGKRPIFVISTLILACAYFWGALATSFKSLLWSHIVAAFAGSASEALAASIVNDLFFLHERANLMGWYLNAICGENTIGPLICGFIVTGSSWRVHKWHSFGLGLVNFLLVLFFVPETRYDRNDIVGEPNRSLSTLVPSLEGKGEISTAETSTTQDVEKIGASAVIERLQPPHSRHTSEVPKKTLLQQLSLWPSILPESNLLKLFLRPLPLVVYPAVILALLGYAVSLAWVVAINILNSFVLQAPPYSWKPDMNGLINIPGLIGNMIGAWCGGWLVDRYSDWMSKRNNGVFQPETRLPLLILPTVVAPAGCLLFGYGVGYSLHWTSLFFAYGMISFGLACVATITFAYVSDSYLPVNADALAMAAGSKNLVAFGFLYAIVPWVQKSGYINAFGTQAGIFVLIMMLAIPIVIWGQKIRHVSAGWKVIL